VRYNYGYFERNPYILNSNAYNYAFILSLYRSQLLVVTDRTARRQCEV
jgi:hypothetical protein